MKIQLSVSGMSVKFAASSMLVAGVLSFMSCIEPTQIQDSLEVAIEEFILIQNVNSQFGFDLESLESCDPGNRSCRSTCRITDAGLSCFLLGSAGIEVPSPFPLRLGDRIVVRPRLARSSGDIFEGSRLSEIVLKAVPSIQLGPASNRFSGDTIDVRSAGQLAFEITSAGFPDAKPDTIRLGVSPTWVANPCTNGQNVGCIIKTWAVGQTIEIRGGPFVRLIDGATGEVLGVLPEPNVTIHGEDVDILGRTDSTIFVSMPPVDLLAGRVDSAVGISFLGVDVPCADPRFLGTCYDSDVYTFVTWDVLEAGSGDTSAVLLTPAVIALVDGQDMALEDQATASLLRGSTKPEPALDWYRFESGDSGAVVVVESSIPVNVTVATSLQWDVNYDRPRVTGSGWSVGANVSCNGVELDLTPRSVDAFATEKAFLVGPNQTVDLVVASKNPLPEGETYQMHFGFGGVPGGFSNDCLRAPPLGGTSGLLEGNLAQHQIVWRTATTTDSTLLSVHTNDVAGGRASIAVLHVVAPDSFELFAEIGNPSAGQNEIENEILDAGDYLFALFGDFGRTGYSVDYLINPLPRNFRFLVPSGLVAGTPFPLQVEVLNGSGAVMAGYTGPVEIGLGGGTGEVLYRFSGLGNDHIGEMLDPVTGAQLDIVDLGPFDLNETLSAAFTTENRLGVITGFSFLAEHDPANLEPLFAPEVFPSPVRGLAVDTSNNVFVGDIDDFVIHQIDTLDLAFTNSIPLTSTSGNNWAFNDLVRHPTTGQMFGLVRSTLSGQGKTRSLATIDLQGGTAAIVTQLSEQGVASIAFRNDGTLLAVTGDGATNPETLWTVDESTGAMTLVRALDEGADGEAIAIGPAFLTGETYVNAVNGIATFPDVTFMGVADDFQFSATALGIPTPITSGQFSVASPAPQPSIPDIRILGMSMPDSVQRGVEFLVDFDVRNALGRDAVPADWGLHVRMFFPLTGADIELARVVIPNSIPSGATMTLQVPLTIPVSFAGPGDYTLIFFANFPETFEDAVEKNNGWGIPFTLTD